MPGPYAITRIATARIATARIAIAVALAGGTACLPAHAQPAAPAAAPAALLEPAAAAALNRMGYHLRQLKQFEVTSQARVEKAFENAPAIEFRQDTSYLVQMPDRMMVDITTDNAHRKIFYDGRQMTVLGMKAARYVTIPVSGSISEVLTRAYNEFGLDFPLQDLFRWGSATAVAEVPTEGFRVGDSVVRGQKVGHYAYRTAEVDFQIWMTEGDAPLPLRMVITQRDGQRLRYASDIIWNLTPTVTASSFTFTPRPGDRPIDLSAARAAR